MKAALFAIVLGVASLANASPLPSKAPTGHGLFAASALPSFEAANRKGSTRVGGSGRSGKGGKYVGGRRK